MRCRIEMGADGLFHARVLVADTVRFQGWQWQDIADGRETYAEAADDITRHRLRQQ